MTDDWGWTSYSRTGWSKDFPDGNRKEYSAHFRTDTIIMDHRGTQGWKEATIYFYAKRITHALKEIAESGRDPMEYNGKVVN